MCYAKPGPRCSAHATEELLRRKQEFQTTSQNEDPGASYEAYHEMREAQKEFDSTPKGQRLLEKKISETENVEEKVKLEERLEQARDARRASLDAWKRTHPSATLNKEDIETDVYAQNAAEVEAQEYVRYEASLSYGDRTKGHPKFEEIRELVKKYPAIYPTAVDGRSTLNSREKWQLAREHGDIHGIIRTMSQAYAKENREELNGYIEQLRSLYNMEEESTNEEERDATRQAYTQATYLAAYTAETEEEHDQVIDSNYPYEVGNPTALGHLTWQAQLTQKQAARYCVNLLEKGSSIPDYTMAVRSFERHHSRPMPNLTAGAPDRNDPIPATPRVEDARIVKNPQLVLSRHQSDERKVWMAQARLDATVEGAEKLNREQAEDAASGGRKAYDLRKRQEQAEEYRRLWWQADHIRKTHLL